MPAIKKASLPLIDISGFIEGDSESQRRAGKEVVDACQDEGFFYVYGHGIDQQLFLNAREQALEFFHSPASVKSAVHISRFPHHRGYVGHNEVTPDPEKGGDIREAFKVAWDLPEDDPDYLAGITMYGPNVWPQGLPQFREFVYAVYLAYQALAENIFGLFATGLGLPRDYFRPMTHKPASIMNVNYYPETEPGDGNQASGVGAHSDYEAFAMLWQDDVGGLQIESPLGEWEEVEPVDDTLVINIGDLMQHWTNDRFRATRHRVVNISGRERVSFACFGNTSYHARIECIPACCDADNPAKYAPVTAGNYLMDAVKRTYAYAQDDNPN